MKEIVILGIHITDRVKEVALVQKVLTNFGCSIKTRLGLHDVEEENSSSDGVIILELTGDNNEFMKLENALNAIEGIKVQKMTF